MALPGAQKITYRTIFNNIIPRQEQQQQQQQRQQQLPPPLRPLWTPTSATKRIRVTCVAPSTNCGPIERTARLRQRPTWEEVTRNRARSTALRSSADRRRDVEVDTFVPTDSLTSQNICFRHLASQIGTQTDSGSSTAANQTEEAVPKSCTGAKVPHLCDNTISADGSIGAG